MPPEVDHTHAARVKLVPSAGEYVPIDAYVAPSKYTPEPAAPETAVTA